jgi:signal transduction histidine kinase
VLNEERKNILDNTKVAGQQMLSLLTNLLEVQRLEDGRMPVHLAPLDLAQMLATAVRQVQPLAVKKAISLRLDAPSSLPLVLGDSDLSLRVVTNLLDNAIKFTPFDGDICVTGQVADAGDQVVVTVADNGPGIPSHEQARVFEAFTQVDQGQARGKGSVGLGLAFCKLAVEAQGDRIWVESDEGRGAQFKFTLSVCPADGMSAEQGDARSMLEQM